jgi:hypothetical protein
MDRVRDRLADKDEEGSIAAMGALDAADAARVLERADLRARAVKAFNDEEMARAIASLKGGTLLAKLRWLKAEGSNLGLVWPLIVDQHTPAAEKRELFLHNDMRDFFVDICGDDEMASVVDVLGGWLEAKLNWMFEEGTSFEAVKVKIRAAARGGARLPLHAGLHAPQLREAAQRPEMSVLVGMLGGTLDQQLTWMASEGTNAGLVYPKVRIAPPDQLTNLRPATRAAIRKELSAKEFRWFERMLDEGVLCGPTCTRPHRAALRAQGRDDPSKGWKLQDFDIDGRYEITYSRTELRVRCGSG